MERDIRRVEEIYRCGFNQYYRPYQTNPIKSKKKPEKSFAEVLQEMLTKKQIIYWNYFIFPVQYYR